jgi:hypothetical protein
MPQPNGNAKMQSFASVDSRSTELSEQSLNNSLPNTKEHQVPIRATGTKNPRAQPPALPLSTGGLLVRIQPEEPTASQSTTPLMSCGHVHSGSQSKPSLRQPLPKKLRALLRLGLALLTTSGFTLTGVRLPDGRAKVRIVRARGSSPRVPPIASGPSVPASVTESVPCLAAADVSTPSRRVPPTDVALTVGIADQSRWHAPFGVARLL